MYAIENDYLLGCYDCDRILPAKFWRLAQRMAEGKGGLVTASELKKEVERREEMDELVEGLDDLEGHGYGVEARRFIREAKGGIRMSAKKSKSKSKGPRKMTAEEKAEYDRESKAVGDAQKAERTERKAKKQAAKPKGQFALLMEQSAEALRKELPGARDALKKAYAKRDASANELSAYNKAFSYAATIRRALREKGVSLSTEQKKSGKKAKSKKAKSKSKSKSKKGKGSKK